MISVINVISDTNIGGAGHQLLTYLQNSDRSRFLHTVLLPEGSRLIDRLKGLSVEYREISGLGEKSLSFGSITAFLRIFSELKPRIVHTHAAMSARIAARLYGKCSIIATRHSVFDQPGYKKSFPYKQTAGMLNNSLADAIIAVSPAAKDNIVEIGANPKKIRVIFNGVDMQSSLSSGDKSEIRQKYGFSDEDFICAILARLEEVKGHEYVLEAARLLSGNKRIKFIIAGTGSREAALKARAEKLSLQNIVFAGFLNDVCPLENIMDIQLNTSYGTEATSLSLLEGMSLGRPAVVSDFGGNPYVIKNGVNGLVVPKRNAEKLARAIKTFADDKLVYERCAKGALEIYEREFTSKKMAENIEALYSELAHISVPLNGGND